MFCARQVYVLKRPHVDEFLQKMGELFECVLFTASLAKVRLKATHLRTLTNRRIIVYFLCTFLLTFCAVDIVYNVYTGSNRK